MKKIVRILGITLTLLVLASCDKEDDNNESLKQKLRVKRIRNITNLITVNGKIF